MHDLEWFRVFVISYPTLQYLVVFLGAAFGGEVAMIALGFLAAQEIFSLNLLFCVSFLGVMSSDILYFWLARTETANRFFTHRYANGTISMITEAVARVSRGSHFIALFLANFMIASRIILIMYVSKTDLKFSRFVYYEAISVVLWLLSLISIGFLSGIGFTRISDNLENIYAGIGFALLVVLAVIALQIWLKRFLVKEGEEIVEEKKVDNMI